jgi:hypothetical protein
VSCEARFARQGWVSWIGTNPKAERPAWPTHRRVELDTAIDAEPTSFWLADYRSTIRNLPKYPWWRDTAYERMIDSRDRIAPEVLLRMQ